MVGEWKGLVQWSEGLCILVKHYIASTMAIKRHISTVNLYELMASGKKISFHDVTMHKMLSL